MKRLIFLLCLAAVAVARHTQQENEEEEFMKEVTKELKKMDLSKMSAEDKEKWFLGGVLYGIHRAVGSVVHGVGRGLYHLGSALGKKEVSADREERAKEVLNNINSELKKMDLSKMSAEDKEKWFLGGLVYGVSRAVGSVVHGVGRGLYHLGSALGKKELGSKDVDDIMKELKRELETADVSKMSPEDKEKWFLGGLVYGIHRAVGSVVHGVGRGLYHLGSALGKKEVTSDDEDQVGEIMKELKEEMKKMDLSKMSAEDKEKWFLGGVLYGIHRAVGSVVHGVGRGLYHLGSALGKKEVSSVDEAQVAKIMKELKKEMKKMDMSNMSPEDKEKWLLGGLIYGVSRAVGSVAHGVGRGLYHLGSALGKKEVSSVDEAQVAKIMKDLKKEMKKMDMSNMSPEDKEKWFLGGLVYGVSRAVGSVVHGVGRGLYHLGSALGK